MKKHRYLWALFREYLRVLVDAGRISRREARIVRRKTRRYMTKKFR